MDVKRFCIIGVLSAGVLVGCGSDSDDTAIGANYSGSEAEGKITDTSKASFEKSAVELVSNFSIAGLAQEELPFDDLITDGVVAIEASGSIQALSYQDEVELIKEFVENNGNLNSSLPTGITQEEVVESTCEGITGTATYSTTSSMSLDEVPVAIDIPESEENQTSEVSQKIVFNNFCSETTDGLVWNGTVESSSTESDTAGSISLSIQNFSMSSVGSNESITFNAKLEISGSQSHFERSLDISLNANGLTAAVSILEECGEEIPNGCQESTVFKGIDGKIHRIDDVDYEYSYGELDYLEGKLYDATHGFVYLDTGEISLCEDGNGNLQLQDSIIRLYQESPVMVDGQQHEVRMEISAGLCGVYESDIFTSEIPQ